MSIRATVLRQRIFGLTSECKRPFAESEGGTAMRAIIVDDEPIMIKGFIRMSASIEDLQIVGRFQKPLEALAFAKENSIDIAFLDARMPKMSGIELAEHLREIDPKVLIVFLSAYGEYVLDSNRIGADYYIMKPYTEETLELAMERMRLLAARQRKRLFAQTFGRFILFRGDEPVPLTGKAKEILAFVVVRRGKEASNEEIYSALWEGRPYSNQLMKVYYNALSRLKAALAEKSLSDLLISTPRGQIINTAMLDCDYYDWQDKTSTDRDRFEGEFLAEYSWGEQMLAEIIYNS